MEQYMQFAPIILIVIAFAVSYKIFVTPSELDSKLTEKIDDKLKNYSTPKELDQKIEDKINDKLTNYMTPVQFQKERAEVLEYMAKNYVHQDTCKSNNNHIMDAINLIRKDINSMGAKFDHMNELIMIRIKQEKEKN